MVTDIVFSIWPSPCYVQPAGTTCAAGSGGMQVRVSVAGTCGSHSRMLPPARTRTHSSRLSAAAINGESILISVIDGVPSLFVVMLPKLLKVIVVAPAGAMVTAEVADPSPATRDWMTSFVLGTRAVQPEDASIRNSTLILRRIAS